MRIMIIGAGQVGRHLSRKFSAEGQDVVLIDRNETRLRRLERELNILAVHGSGASVRVLEDAGIDNSELFIAVTDSDEVNLVACLLSKKYNVKKRVAPYKYPRIIRIIRDPLPKSGTGKILKKDLRAEMEAHS